MTESGAIERIEIPADGYVYVEITRVEADRVRLEVGVTDAGKRTVKCQKLIGVGVGCRVAFGPIVEAERGK